jgi:hypothetical protein
MHGESRLSQRPLNMDSQGLYIQRSAFRGEGRSWKIDCGVGGTRGVIFWLASIVRLIGYVFAIYYFVFRCIYLDEHVQRTVRHSW